MRYFAWLYAGTERDLFATLFEIEREVESSLRADLDHQIAHLRLAWWREECGRFAEGRPVHPITRRLRELAVGGDRAVDLTGLLEATAWDLASATPETRAELEQHCSRWAGTMITPLTRATSATSVAHAFGSALRETELLLRLAPDARRGRLRLPLEELDVLGLEPQTLASPAWPPVLADHVRHRLESLRENLRSALPALDAPGLHAWSAVLSASARRFIRALPQPPRGRRLEGLADAVHAWRAARASSHGSVRLP
jgi:15-cis-phytoene synthase